MRWRLLIWMLAGSLLLTVFWRLGNPQPPRRQPAPRARSHDSAALPGEDSLRLPLPAVQRAPPPSARYPHRLANTAKTPGQLARSDKAILLENALLDTEQPTALAIPAHLRAQGDPGSYIVQSRRPLDHSFRSLLRQAGADIIAYIPNNACLVRASQATAQVLAAQPQTQVVLPYEPYYKLKPSLLELALNPESTPNPEFGAQSSSSGIQSSKFKVQGSRFEVQSPAPPLNLSLLLFADSRAATLAAVQDLGAEIISEERSPFGPLLKIRSPSARLAALARLPGVQELELARSRVPANDLSRAAIGIACNALTPTNYLGLTGSNILINLNDTGVDTNHPDLFGRVFCDSPDSGVDANGHGTHVAGIIAGSGAQSLSLTNAPGSPQYTAPFQFRGKAPGATIFSISVDLAGGSPGSDAYLQQTAAGTNAFISNNSWLYSGDNDYDLAAASYDAAVRDALPAVPGSQPILYVFAAGNSGAGDDNGAGGNPGSIQSPATAKNVITVGALELPRFITNETWTCTDAGTNGPPDCRTNRPWLGLTDNAGQVAAFSSRGNVGIGAEGDFGRFKPDVVAPGTFVISACSGNWDQSAYYTQTNLPFIPSPDTNSFGVLSNLNNALGPFYRFESGTSLSAADVSGTLALMQQFFEQRLSRTNSPALMKALLINGARPLTNLYHPQVNASTNFQGWGLVQLPSSLPAALTNLGSPASPMFLFDQNPTDALATGQSQTRLLSLSDAARSQPLRVTLVWTDPPGNPVAGLKLVNNLDLIVTNLDTGAVFFGNDIAAGNDFNLPWDTNAAPNLDLVNNVENVCLAAPLGTNYSITVVGQRVNVNAVTAHTNDIVQDYALVISSGNGQLPNALTLTDSPPVFATAPLVTVLTNNLVASPSESGAILLRQRAGANSPLLSTNTIPLPDIINASLTIGTTNQWHFYVFTNETAFTNAAFLTVGQASCLSPLYSPTNAPYPEPDIDLYVSRDPGLTSLDPAVIAAADKSLGRGATETVLYSNATPGIYYIGVKCESQQAAEYSFLGIFSEPPFAQTDERGNQILRGFPAPAAILAGAPDHPGATAVFCLAPDPILVRRVIVTNTLTHPAMSDLLGTLTHGGTAVVLNRYSTNSAVTSQSFVYDDSGEGDVPGAQPADGPGSLRQFAGRQGLGLWLLTMLSTNQPGSDDSLSIFLERQPDLTGNLTASILPGACRDDFILLPPEATNLTAAVTLDSGSGPLLLQLCPFNAAAADCQSLQISDPSTSGILILDKTSHPPLNSGLYAVRLCNSGLAPATVSLSVTVGLAPKPPTPVQFTSAGPTAILDDAVSFATMFVTNSERIGSVDVGVHIDHPRVSDLVLYLVSPRGIRVLLDQNRGGDSRGMGTEILSTNTLPVSYSGGPEAYTNIIDTGQTSGTINISYDFYTLPDTMHVYYESNLLFDSGLVSNTGAININYGPGAATSLAIVMNEGGNANSNTAWFYTVTSTYLDSIDLTFTENTNLTVTPIKFASPPFTNLTYSNPNSVPSNGIFYLPEQSLSLLAGQPASGLWTLEIWDTRAGASVPAPALLRWQLSFILQDSVPAPVPLEHGRSLTNTLAADQLQWFSIDVPAWASFATNSLLAASAPANLLFNQSQPPTGTNTGDLTLLANSTAGAATLQTNGVPPLVPGTRYFLGIQNTNPAPVTFILEVSFDITPLTNGLPLAFSLAASPASRYFFYDVSTNATSVSFQLLNLTGDANLVARNGLPLPTLDSFVVGSFNPWTGNELILLSADSYPVPLSPGRWYLGVLNADPANVAGTILATEFPLDVPHIVITNQALTSDSFCLTWTSLPGVSYFVQGNTGLEGANWAIVSSTITATDFQTTFCLPLPSPYHFFRVHQGLVPADPPPVISAISYSTNGVLLRWATPDYARLRFQVEFTPTLFPPFWQSFTNILTSTNDSFMFLDDGSQSGGLGDPRYYRLMQLP